MEKFMFLEALDDKIHDESTIYVFKFKGLESAELKEIVLSSTNQKCLFEVLKITAILLGEELSEVSTDDFFSIAAGYTQIEGEFYLDDSYNLVKA